MSAHVSTPRLRQTGLWHVHTELTDGAHDVETLLDVAESLSFPVVGFAEHVRRKPTYDFEKFHERAHALADDRPVDCLVGCEAKVLDTEGTIDASDAVLDTADVVYGAFHGTPFAREAYVESALAMLGTPSVDVWAHPFDYVRNQEWSLSLDEVRRILARASREEVLFELNLGRGIPSLPGVGTDGLETIVGYDLHRLDRWPVLHASPDDTLTWD